MAATALEIISLDEAKDQLGLDRADASQDARVSTLVGAAVRCVETYTGLTLVDGMRTEKFYPRGNRYPVLLRTRGIVAESRSEVPVKYLDSDNEEQEVMAVLYRGGSANDMGARYRLYPPVDDGWPDCYGVWGLGMTREHSVDLTVRGPATADVPADLKVAGLLLLTGFYETGILDSVPASNPAAMMMEPYKTDGV